MPELDPSIVLVVGGGGREHALAWAIARSARVRRVFVAPGNGGTAAEPKVENVGLADTDVDGLVAFAAGRSIGLTVVGPEKPLEAGIVDAFRAAGLPVFGPTRAAARIETSKAWAREFMARHGVPHPQFTIADDLATAERAIRVLGGRCVVKADGLAAGKGVVVCGGVDEAVDAARDMLEGGAFGASGATVLVEERADGPELSIMAVTDGDDYVLLPPAQDYKRLLDGDRGPNTGGMGSYAPAPIATPEIIATVRRTVIEPVFAGMRAEGHPFTGCLFAGLMLTDGGPVVIEFNGRFGDPETQVQLPLVASDLTDLLRAAASGGAGIGGVDFRLRTGTAAVSVALASDGYPGRYAVGVPIYGLGDVANRDGNGRRDGAVADYPDTLAAIDHPPAAIDGVKVFHAGTRVDPATGAVVSAGGRVLNVVCVRPTLADAVVGAYGAIGDDSDGGDGDGDGVWFEGMRYRGDVARAAPTPGPSPKTAGGGEKAREAAVSPSGLSHGVGGSSREVS